MAVSFDSPEYTADTDALWAKDYVEMQWLMLQQDSPDDFVIATGKKYSVREFIEIATSKLQISLRREGSGVEEKGYDTSTGKVIVVVDPQYYRPTEVETLLGDPSKAKKELGWEPKITFEELVTEMVENDLDQAMIETFFV